MKACGAEIQKGAQSYSRSWHLQPYSRSWHPPELEMAGAWVWPQRWAAPLPFSFPLSAETGEAGVRASGLRSTSAAQLLKYNVPVPPKPQLRRQPPVTRQPKRSTAVQAG